MSTLAQLSRSQQIADSAPITKSKKRFQKVNIEISNICNLQCSFCPAVLRENQLMELDLFESIIEQVAPLTDMVCLHLMGDPLVHPQLDEMVHICEQWGVKIFLVSNGVLLREAQSELLLNPIFHQVNFSLHSFFDNFPNKDPAKYLARIFNFTERALSERSDLYINFRLWNLNDVRGSQTPNNEMLGLISERFGFTAPTEIDVRTKKSINIKGRLYLHFDTEFIWPSLELPVLGTQGRCHGLASHFGILVDGTVVPCCLDKEASIALGNVRDEPALQILDSPRAKAIFNGFKQRKLVEDLCQRCQYIERFA